VLGLISSIFASDLAVLSLSGGLFTTNSTFSVEEVAREAGAASFVIFFVSKAAILSRMEEDLLFSPGVLDALEVFSRLGVLTVEAIFRLSALSSFASCF